MTESLPIPQAGLSHVLSGWNGQGQLIDALAAVQAPIQPIDRSWTAIDIRRRAHRTLMARLEPDLLRLPTSQRVWADALPAATAALRFEATQPLAGTLWTDTRRIGWPPDTFVVRRRSRSAEETTVSTLAWVADRLARVAEDARRAEPTVSRNVDRQLRSLFSIRGAEPVSSSAGIVPDRGTLRALDREGRPWGAVASLATQLTAVEKDLHVLAHALIEPDGELRWRLFHLAVLGRLLLTLQRHGASIRSLRPLSGTSTGPAYVAQFQNGRKLDLWFEAAGTWSKSGKRSPYREATIGLPSAGSRSLGPDLLLLDDAFALVIECKYSSSGSYIASGYEQLVTYMAEIRSRMTPNVHGVLVAPAGVISPTGTTHLDVGIVTMTSVEAPDDVIDGTIKDLAS